MATFRSNLNSVSTALKKRITTCFQHWRRQNIQQQHHQREYYQRLLYHESRLGNLANKTSENLKVFNTKLRKLFKKSSKSSRQCDEQIVAKLFSSTLIATTTTTTRTFTTTTTSASVGELSEANMTIITDEAFMEVREEYPDLDVEVRSILISRAQGGATISNIRDDYRKNVGLKFPIYDNVTEYLLSIPTVSAMCDEHGTRIFSIIPTEKTKHLYEMVQQQKPSQAQGRPSYPSGGRRRIHPYAALSNRAAQSWRSNSTNPQQDYNNNNNANANRNAHQAEYFQNNYGFATATVSASDPPQQQQHQHQQQQQQQFVTAAALETALVDKCVSRSDSDGFVENNCYYQDNCNYFYGRLYNQQPNTPPFVMEHNFNANEILNLNENINMQNNNNNNNFNPKIFHPQSLLQPLQPLHPLQIHHRHNRQNLQNLNLNNMNTNTRPKQHVNNFRQIFSGPCSGAICSSPSGTRSSRTNESNFTSDSDYEAHLLDFPLLGDDFFLYMARMELKCKFKKYHKILESGLCVSGQTISAAAKRIRKLNDMDKHIIVNIGSVDILQGRPLVQIEYDFRQLITTMRKKGITPILTTLAPLVNYFHEPLIKQTLERFNEFIKRQEDSLRVIDIYPCLMNERKKMRLDCYQSEPRSVTGATTPYVFWNKIGRQRVLKLIESKLEY